MNILVVDDEKEIAGLVEIYLKNENYKVDVCYTGTQALQNIRTRSYDLAILDVMLPDMDGFSICRTIRQNYTWPIIMLTAKEQDIDKINGLMIGADDYMTKPFQPLELIARVKAQLRRYKRYNVQQKAKELSYLGLVMNQEQHICRLNEKDLNLTPIEFRLLWYLCERQGKVVSARELYTAIWQEEYLSSSNNTLMVHIRHIREKMAENTRAIYKMSGVWAISWEKHYETHCMDTACSNRSGRWSLSRCGSAGQRYAAGIFVRTVFLYGRIYGYDRYPASVSFSQLVSNQAAAFFADGTGCCNLYCLRADTKQPCRYEAQGRDRKGDGNGPASVFGGSRFLSSGGLW